VTQYTPATILLIPPVAFSVRRAAFACAKRHFRLPRKDPRRGFAWVCQPQTVLLEVAGNGGRRWVFYTVALGAHVFVPIDEPPNLGNWARPGVIPLRIERLSRHFQLRVTEVSSREGRQIRHDKHTVLEEMDDSGRVIRSLPISEGTLYESTGG
jgi:hypothetical protein